MQLGNLKAMPVGRIHSMLNNLVPSYKGHTVDELTALLGSMMGEGVVDKTAGGDWKIVK